MVVLYDIVFSCANSTNCNAFLTLNDPGKHYDIATRAVFSPSAKSDRKIEQTTVPSARRPYVSDDTWCYVHYIHKRDSKRLRMGNGSRSSTRLWADGIIWEISRSSASNSGEVATHTWEEVRVSLAVWRRATSVVRKKRRSVEPTFPVSYRRRQTIVEPSQTRFWTVNISADHTTSQWCVWMHASLAHGPQLVEANSFAPHWPGVESWPYTRVRCRETEKNRKYEIKSRREHGWWTWTKNGSGLVAARAWTGKGPLRQRRRAVDRTCGESERVVVGWPRWQPRVLTARTRVICWNEMENDRNATGERWRDAHAGQMTTIIVYE